MDNKRIATTSIGVLIGGGLMFGLAKATRANSGLSIIFIITGASIGGLIGYAR
jgi:hypothetical protein